MRFKIVLLFFSFFHFWSCLHSQTFNSDLDYDIEVGCSDSLDVIIDLSNENLPSLDDSQFGIVEVCIDIDHSWLSDIEVFLRGPMGITVELSSDNGENEDDYHQACFNMNGNAGPIIFGQAPMTGNFIPEGDINEFNNNYNPNGVWELILCDDAAGFSGSITHWSISFGTPVFTTCSAIDSFVLADFYKYQGGNSWINSDGWLDSGTPYKDWYGVDVNENGCVTKLNLGANNLFGPIYPNLDLFSALNKIDFQNNELIDTLPASIGEISTLDSLNLSNNPDLLGEYPASYLSLCLISFTDFGETMLPDFGEFCNLISATKTPSNSMNIFPNPFSETLNIESIDLINSIRIYNLSGSIIQLSNEKIKSKLNLKNLPNGIYFLEILQNDGNKIIHKIVKI